MTDSRPNIVELDSRALTTEDRLRDLRGQYREPIRSARTRGNVAQADTWQAEWDAARAPLEAIVAECDAARNAARR